MKASNLRECTPVEISDSDVMAAMKSVQGYLHILIPVGQGAVAMLIVALPVNNLAPGRRDAIPHFGFSAELSAGQGKEI